MGSSPAGRLDPAHRRGPPPHGGAPMPMTRTPGYSMAGSSAMSTNQGRSGLARGRRSFSLRSAVLTESRATSSQLNCRPEKSRHGFRLGSGSPRLRGWSPCSLRCSGPARFGSVGGTRFRPRAAGCRPPPGETRMIGSARSPRPHEKGDAALTLAGPGVTEAGFALPRDAGQRPVASSPGGGPLSCAVLAPEVRAEKRAIPAVGVCRLGSLPPRPCGPLCRPPPGELAGGRRSKPSPRFGSVS